ncbi:MAG TPA: 23S rRNA (adenine(2503)-C(2))-methyltransferase RlmN [Candidatus Saccharicenans sp.]|jgi:23S rRNA (adenine2503-C2)-methyltransferase|nr:23S rRNA (adenine(2503)-C(2))-methyltransferase RlmN [Candidatus Saccharicenans sp.]HRD02726.1 23S rRNA (adenine(2503)-C(2))-methyltransferase RlmN [Candidatus Saccharicenans sp.]
MSQKKLLTSMTRVELEAYLTRSGQPSYRSDQIFRWVYQAGKSQPAEFTDLPLELRQRLDQDFIINPLELKETVSSKDGTIKYLFELQDGNFIETVMIPAAGRKTFCLSTQVGCKFHCAFCASGLHGFKRNLEAGEIVAEVLNLKYDYGHQPTNLVLMGMGEPLDNLDNVLKAIRILNDQHGLAIGARRITVSTVGLIPGLKKLMNFESQINLSLSIHSAVDEKRTQLMPVNKKLPLEKLIKAAEDYLKAGGRQLTLEYIVIGGFNDSLYDAEALAAISRRLKAKVNLIAYSPVAGLRWQSPTREEMERFKTWLEERKVRVTIRQSKGIDIAAACGQLAGKFQ